MENPSFDDGALSQYRCCNQENFDIAGPKALPATLEDEMRVGYLIFHIFSDDAIPYCHAISYFLFAF